MSVNANPVITKWLNSFGDLLDEGIPSVHQLFREARIYKNIGQPESANRCINLIYLLHNTSIAIDAKLQSDTRLAYGGIGVVIHHAATFGKDVLVGQNVTIGGNGGKGNRDKSGKLFYLPKIGNHVYIAAGARLLGGIEIGDYTVIAANAVVLQSIPPLSIVGGTPAQVLKKIDAKNALQYKDYFGFAKKLSDEEYLEKINEELNRNASLE